MRLALLLVVCGACSEHGSGIAVETFARLPVDQGYAIGFDADSTPLLGFTNQLGPIARADHGDWLPAANANVFVASFGNDIDGTPLVAMRGADGILQIGQLANGAVTAISDPPNTSQFNAVMQDSDGARYGFSFSFAMRLPPGQRTWQSFPLDAARALRGSDGAIYVATNTTGVVRLEPGGTTSTILPCSRLGSLCASSMFGGIDATNHAYFASNDAITVFAVDDPADITTIHLPAGRMPLSIMTSGSTTLVATFGDSGELLVFAIPAGATAAAAVRLPLTVGFSNMFFQTDLAGKIYVAAGDWLGVAEQL